MSNPIYEPLGYKEKTTFWLDFSIADKFGLQAIEDTYNRAFKGWRDNVEYFTELCMVLNHKIWQHYERNEEYAKLYDRLWREADEWAYENLKGNDLIYYMRTTD